jgi:hypothetical protein
VGVVALSLSGRNTEHHGGGFLTVGWFDGDLVFLTKAECGESRRDSWRPVYANKEVTWPDAGAFGRTILEYV